MYKLLLVSENKNNGDEFYCRNSCGWPLQKLIVTLFGGKTDKECEATPTSWFSYSISEATEEGIYLTQPGISLLSDLVIQNVGGKGEI